MKSLGTERLHYLLDVEKRLGLDFNQLAYLDEALTHSSYAEENGSTSNERLEFLGDSVLGLIVTDLVMDRFPFASEGKLSQIRSGLVKNDTLARIGISIGLLTHLRVGKGMQMTDKCVNTVVSCAFEALVGAIYSDKGMPAASLFVRNIMVSYLEESFDVPDYKTLLQELTQKVLKKTPSYKVIRQEGPLHAVQYSVSVTVGRSVKEYGYGTSIKEAEKDAAKRALRTLEG